MAFEVLEGTLPAQTAAGATSVTELGDVPSTFSSASANVSKLSLTAPSDVVGTATNDATVNFRAVHNAAETLQALLPAQALAGATSVTSLGAITVPLDAVLDTVGFKLTSPSLVTGTATNYATINFRKTAGQDRTTTDLTTGAGTLAVAVQSLPTALLSGTTVTITTSGHTDTCVLSAAAAKGAVTLAINSKTFNFAYPLGSVITWPAVVVGTLALTSGNNLAAATAVAVSFTGAILDVGDTIDVQLVQTGTGLALPANIAAEMDIRSQVANVVGSIELLAGANLYAEVETDVPVTTSLVNASDVMDVQCVQNGTGLALPANIKAKVELT